MTEAFAWDTAPRYLVRDCDAVYGHSATISEATRLLDYAPNPGHYLDNLRKAGLPE